jgi:hypothetical protein
MNKSLLKKKKASVLLGIFIVLLLVSISGCLEYDKVGDYKVGVMWVNDYSKIPGKDNLSNRNLSAEGFYNEIKNLPNWKGGFNHGDFDVWEYQFTSSKQLGLDWIQIDSVDFAYFAGHGCGSIPQHNTGDCFTLGTGYAKNPKKGKYFVESTPNVREVEWGDQDLEWIVLDCCSALADLGDEGVKYSVYERWGNFDVMHGLHHILGFKTIALDHWLTGSYLARYLIGKQDGINHTIESAWKETTIDTHGNSGLNIYGALLRAESDGMNTAEDHLPGFGYVSEDPDIEYGTIIYLTWPC